MPKRRQPKAARSKPKTGALLFAGGLAVLLACVFFALRGEAPSERPAAAYQTNLPGKTGGEPSLDTNELFEVDIDKATDHLLKGNEWLASGKLEEAVREFRLSAKYNPEDEDVYYNLALALAQKGDVAGAKTNYAKSLELFPDYVEAHNNLGNLLVREGNFADALKHFEAALANDPENASAHNNLGNALARQKKIPDSIVHFEEAVRLKPDYAEALFNLGNAYLLANRPDEAARQFMLLLNTHPDFPRAREQLQRAQALAQTR